MKASHSLDCYKVGQLQLEEKCGGGGGVNEIISKFMSAFCFNSN